MVKTLFYCVAFIAAISFFFHAYSYCLADVLTQQLQADASMREDIGQQSSIYQPFIDPISNWQTITGYSIYVCSYLDGADNFHNVHILSADTVNDCLDPEYIKCDVQLTNTMPSFTCPETGLDGNSLETINLTASGTPYEGGVLHYTPYYCETDYNGQILANNVLCGISVNSDYNPYNYDSSHSYVGVFGQCTEGVDCNGWQYSFNFYTGSSTYPLYFDLRGTLQAVNTGDCYYCGDINNSGSLTDNIKYALQCSLRATACFWFQPDTSAVSNIEDSLNILQAKFPMTLWYSLINVVDSALSTSTDMTGTIGLPMARVTATGTSFYFIDVLSSSSMPKAIGQTNTNNFRNGLAWIGWGAVVTLIICSFFWL